MATIQSRAGQRLLFDDTGSDSDTESTFKGETTSIEPAYSTDPGTPGTDPGNPGTDPGTFASDPGAPLEDAGVGNALTRGAWADGILQGL